MRFFCVPVVKTKPGEPPQPLFNRTQHLAVYELSPQPHEETITTEDQLTAAELSVRDSVYLAVPSRKRDWGVAN